MYITSIHTSITLSISDSARVCQEEALHHSPSPCLPVRETHKEGVDLWHAKWRRRSEGVAENENGEKRIKGFGLRCLTLARWGQGRKRVLLVVIMIVQSARIAIVRGIIDSTPLPSSRGS